MKITADTKISDLIKANPASIDAIASINKHFKKLKNPILRRTLARRVTIKDAARIGGVDVDVFFEKLSAIGFKTQSTEKILKEEVKSPASTSFLTGKEPLTELDVRPIIEGGDDPFQLIMKTIKTIPNNGVLKIINTFEPIPLINILREDGWQSEVTRPEEGVVLTFFKKGDTATNANLESTAAPLADFDKKMQQYCEKLKTIDVRPLEMPEPMVRILSELEVLPQDQALFVHHKKFPKFLIPELKNRGYQLVEKRIDDHNLDLLIFKEN